MQECAGGRSAARAPGAAAPMAFAWPTRPLRTTQGPAKRSKQSLLRVLQDLSTHPGKTMWAIKLMKKFKFFKSYWEYTLGMKKLTQVGYWEEALRLWSEMLAHGIEAPPAAYSAAIVAWNSGKQWQQAVRLVDEMYDRNMAPIRIGCEHALMAYERGAMWQKALRLLDEMWNYGITPDEETYMPTIRACENGGHFVEADKLFRQMREQTKLAKAAEDIGGPPARRPPRAAPAPWRIPGAVAPDAYDPPRLLKPPKLKPEKTPQLESQP